MSLRPPALATAFLLANLAGCAAPPMQPPARRSPHPAGAVAGPAEAGGPPQPLDEPSMRDDEPPPGVFYTILRGQTLFNIARTYEVRLEAIVEANEIADPDRIEAGALLFIPGVEHLLEVPVTVPAVPDVRFLLPADGPIHSGFGPRGGRMHYGLDIGAPAGGRVRAARPGTVLYAGSGYRGYGKLVILDHGDGFRTLYAHNRRLRTRAGHRVDAGEVIADIGATGNATGPHLHFEIRLDDRPVDPARYLDSAPSP